MVKRQRILHVACLPFPTAQGTQAAVTAMARASASRFETHLLTYGYGLPTHEEPFQHHRLANIPKLSSLRSGPSFGKIAQDAQMVFRLKSLCASLQPTTVIAHHVEAAWAASMAKVPHVYVAHTALGLELPAYVPQLAAQPATFSANVLEQFLCNNAISVAAVSPALQTYLKATTSAPISYVPIPWSTAKKISRSERRLVRAELGIHEKVFLACYAGNLDAYQGVDDVCSAMKVLNKSHPDSMFMIATQSPLTDLDPADRLGCLTTKLETDSDRRRVHAACDAIVVPRRIPGGIPVKMLDALSRGVPVVATHRAASSLELGDACIQVADDRPHAIAAALEKLATDRPLGQSLSNAARAYIERHHSVERFLQALCAIDHRLEPRSTEKSTLKSTYAQASQLLDRSL